MRPVITALQPDARVPLDRFGPWPVEAGADVATVPLWRARVPELDDCGRGIILLGGRSNARNRTTYPWLPEVHALLRDAVAAQLPVLGICLDHQIPADAFGGSLSLTDDAGGEKGPVTVTPAPGAAQDPVLARLSRADRSAVVAQSHSDAVTSLPEGARLLASSEHYPVQAFRLGSALGVQFHPEAAPETVGDWIARRGGDGDAMTARMREVDREVAAGGRAIARAFARQALSTRSELGIGDT